MTPPTLESRRNSIKVLFVDENASDRARSSIEIFICTPCGKIDTPRVKLQRDISCCMCKIEANKNIVTMRMLDYSVYVVVLACKVMHWREEYYGSVGCMMGNGLKDKVERNDCLPWGG